MKFRSPGLTPPIVNLKPAPLITKSPPLTQFGIQMPPPLSARPNFGFKPSPRDGSNTRAHKSSVKPAAQTTSSMPRAGSLVGDILAKAKDRQPKAASSSSVKALHEGVSTARTRAQLRSGYSATRSTRGTGNNAWATNKQKTISESVLSRRSPEPPEPASRANKVRASKERRPPIHQEHEEQLELAPATEVNHDERLPASSPAT